jgi:hypothetical protein
MKKIFILLASMFLLASCVESVAVIGTGAANGKLVQSSINSGISYGIKKQTGKTPLGHALAYAEKKPIEKRESCKFFNNKINLDMCLKVKERITSNQAKIKKNKPFYDPSKELTLSLRSSINEKFKIKYLD